MAFAIPMTEIIRNLIEVDDDNDAAPENVPQAGEGEEPGNIFGEFGAMMVPAFAAWEMLVIKTQA